MIDEEIVININGKKFSGWMEIEVSLGMLQLAGSFAMVYTENYPGQMGKVSFHMGDECIIEVNGHTLVTGHIEEIDKIVTENGISLQVRGRDRLGDLVDCSYWKEGHSGEWNDQSVLSVIQSLVADFEGVDVVVDITATNVVSQILRQNFKAEEGDTIQDALIKLSQSYAFLPIGYGDGKLTLTRSSTNVTNTHLVLGGNVLSSRLMHSNLQRFKHYIVKGVDAGYDNVLLESETEPFGKAEDDSITRFRPLVILADGKVNYDICQSRAEWESKIRAGRSRKYMYTVQGWLQNNGEPWPINKMVNIYDEELSPTPPLLIEGVSYKLTKGGGKTTELTIVDKSTYDLIEKADKIKGKFDVSALIDTNYID